MAKVTLLFGSDPQGEFALEKPETSIGRSRDCDIVVDNLGVSRHHCSILRQGATYKVVDRGSNNGTFLNNVQVEGESALKDQDRIVLGKFSLIFEARGAVDLAAFEAQRQSQSKGMGSEMTMFVDPEAVKQMQEKIKAGESVGRRVLAVRHGGRELSCALIKRETTIGKGLEADVPVRGLLVRPVQARVVQTDGGHRLINMGGMRSVFVNNVRVKEAQLRPGDEIRIAGTRIAYRQP